MSNALDRAKRAIPAPVKGLLRRQRDVPNWRRSYSQDGEDVVLASLFDEYLGGSPGFYVDVGAHHPECLSNTKLFYDMGWRGINIDPLPGAMEMFCRDRPRDINLGVAISNEPGAMTYYCFNNPLLNGFDAELAESREGFRGARILSATCVGVHTLRDVLAENLPPGQSVDFLSVDVEGLDLHVLESNDWRRVRPGVVLVEDGDVIGLDDMERSPIAAFMCDHGYRAVAKTRLTTLYAEAQRIERMPFGIQIRREIPSAPVGRP